MLNIKNKYMLKLVNSETEEIYNILSINVETEVCQVEYQIDNYSQKQSLVLHFWQFIDSKFVNFVGYVFNGWKEPDWWTRTKISYENQSKLVYDNPEFLEILKEEPANPIYKWNGSGSMIYLGYKSEVEQQYLDLIEAYGGIIEHINQTKQ